MSYGTKLSEPQKKRWITSEKHPPFPVPISSITGLQPSATRWQYYTGELVGNVVLVKHSGDIEWLYNMGFFGKGTLSGSKPVYTGGHQRGPQARKRQCKETDTDKRLRLLSRRKFLTHLSWAREKGQLPERDASIDLKEHRLQLPLESKSSKKQKTVSSEKQPNILSADNKPSQSGIGIQSGDSRDKCDLPVQKSHDQQGDADWPKESHDLESGEEADPWKATSKQEAEEFWGTPSTTKVKSSPTDTSEVKISPKGHSKDSRVECQDNISHSPEPMEVGKAAGERLDVKSRVSDLEGSPQGGSVADPDAVVWQSEKEDSEKMPMVVTETHAGSAESTEITSASRRGCDPTSEICSSDEALESKKEVVDDAHLISGKDNRQTESADVSRKVAGIIHDSSAQPESANPSGGGKTADIGSSQPRPMEEVVSDEEGDTFVIDDSEDSEVKAVDDTRLPWRPVIKQDPFPLKEYLQLSLEEAFFLSYGLGCLLVLNEHKVALTLSEMWRRFSDTQATFIHRYIAYHNFRSKGWVPKSGIKYGADFVVYKEGPPFYHSSYTVTVAMVDEGSLSNTSSTDRQFTWTSLAAMNRVTEQVIKESMFCHVIRPSSLTEAELRSPACIPHFKIQEMILKRWVSSSEREHAEYMLIP